MRFRTRIAALLLMVAMVLTTSGCSGDTAWAAELDGEQLSAGVFLYYQLEAYMAAQEELEEIEKANGSSSAGEEDEVDFLDKEINGMKMSDYITQNAWEAIDRYYAIWDLVEQYGIPTDEAFEDEVDEYVADQWPNLEASMLQNGVSEASFDRVARTIVITNYLFEYYYSAEGPEPVTVEDLKDVYANDYARVLSILIQYHDGQLNYYDADAVEALQAKAEQLAAKLNAGENFSDVQAEYNTWKGEFDVAYTRSHPQPDPETGEEPDMTDVEPMVYDDPYELPEPVSYEERKEAFENHGGYEQVLRVDNNTGSYADYVNAVFEMDYYDAQVISSDYAAGWYVTVRLDMLESEEQMEDRYLNALAYSHADAFNEMLAEHGRTLGYTRNEAAYKAYTPDKVVPVEE